MKVLLLEFNEINWRLLDPLIERGTLPTFAHLKAQGAWGSPQSVDLGNKLDPWITWTTVYTGKPQTEHGVCFLEQPPETIRSKRIWDMVADAGLSVGVFGSLNSWPPRPVKGFWVPGTFAKDPDTYPSRLRPIQELNLTYTRGYNYGAFRGTGGFLWKVKTAGRLAGLGLTPRSVFQVVAQLARERVNAKAAWKRVSLQPLINFDLFARLHARHQPDFATFHTNHVAHYQHLYWRAMQPELFPQEPAPDERETYGEAIEHGYRVADRILRRALRLLSPDTVLIVASSMGQQPYINQALEKGKRLLRLRSYDAFLGLLGAEDGVRIVPTMADQFNIYAATKESLLRLRDIIAGSYVDTPQQPLFHFLDRGNSLTVCLRQFNAVSDLSLCHFPVQGAVRQAHFGDLVEVFDHAKSGHHHPTGMVMIFGPGVRPGPIRRELSNLDLAPTILTLLGLGVPPDLTGRVITEALQHPTAVPGQGAEARLEPAGLAGGTGKAQSAWQ